MDLAADCTITSCKKTNKSYMHGACLNDCGVNSI